MELMNDAITNADTTSVGGTDAEKITAKFNALLNITTVIAGQFDTLKESITRPNKKDTKFSLTKERGIEKVPNFSGARSEFINWARRVEVFVGDDVHLRDLLRRSGIHQWTSQDNR